MIRLDNLHLSYGERTLFDGISAQINPRDRIGLVGANGAGKTTLLRALCGEDILDGGKVESARYLTAGYLPQEGTVHGGRSLFEEVEGAFEELQAVQERIDAAARRLQSESVDETERNELITVIGELEHRLEDLEAHKLQSKIEKVLFGLGFSGDDLRRPCAEFSGGWQMRIALAKLLLREPALLLLDEPTNHLDLDSLRWLEKYLRTYDGAILLVSHDRAFLDALCETIFHLTNRRLDVYRGNFTVFERESRARRELLLKAAENQRRQRAHLQRYVDRFRYKASKAKQAQSRLKMLERMELLEVEAEERSIGFTFSPPVRSGHVVLELAGVSKAYGSHAVFRGLDLEITRGERIAVVGVNGAGKSTLAGVLAGAEPFENGSRKVGHKVELSYFAQDHAEALDPVPPVLELTSETAEGKMAEQVRDVLGSFLFTGDDVFKPSGVLSGGEKNRLALARMLLRPANCLIFDEPTNHLDMQSKEVLQRALEQFTGTLVIVSHDRDFLKPLADRVLEVTHAGVRSYPGTLPEFIEHLDGEEAAGNLKSANPGPAAPSPDAGDNPRARRQRAAERRRQLAPLRSRAKRLEEKVASLEAAVGRFETEMADPEFFRRGDATAEDLKHYESLKRKLDRAMQDWEDTNRELESFD